ncbi:competence/damage-inducible protein A [Alicyclobacillus pomorum]|uniref:competence/damage-inducible protein A n=1 Tax=Alicyclobacillus pomorum TaxID=204470 RepID=UPI00047BCA97|nr:competence/damage-inducible protein A [Alicyclobacillus pomorum]
MKQECVAEHIAIGTEILLGQILNAHAQTVSLEFANHGLFIYHHQAVGDNLSRIVDVLNHAAGRSNVIVLTGGIGPTEDDLTRDAVAAHLGVALELDEKSLQDIESYFRKRGRSMPAENRRQAMRIQGATMLPNPYGTAPGQYVEHGGVHYFLLPGPPLEMKPMLQREVLPRLKRIFPTPQVLVSRTLHFCGIGESHVDEQIHDLLSSENPTVAPLAGEGEMLLRITARGGTHQDAVQSIARVEQEIRKRFAPYIYGVDGETLQAVAFRLLAEQQATLSVAESCTGGQISTMLTGVPGVSQVFAGGVVAYDNAVKRQALGVHPETLERYGAVSEQTAREMAEGVRERLGTVYGLSTTGIAGPGGGSDDKPVGLVYMAVAGPRGTEVFRSVFSGSREQIRLRAAKHTLWRLIRTLTRGAGADA